MTSYRTTLTEYEAICDQIRALKRKDSSIVFTNGCFDLLHLGHVRVFEECRRLAGPLGFVVVGVNSDESVRRLKGKGRPIIDEDARCQMVISNRYVDFVVMFEEDTPLKLIESLRPDVIVKGGDYKASEVIGGDKCMVKIVPLEDKYSTTKIMEKIKNGR